MGLTTIKNWLHSDPSGKTPSMRRLAKLVMPVLIAAFVGAGLGGVIGSFVIASAPALPVMPAVTTQPPVIVSQSRIEVEALEAPPRPALALTIPGAPHRPALYALLLGGETDGGSDVVIAGAPHRLSSFAQLFWFYGLQEQEPETVIPGPAHKPAELAALYAQSLNATPSPVLVIPGAPHRPAETGLVTLASESMEDESGARLVWVEKPDPAEPGRLNERLAFPDQDEEPMVATTVVPEPHTMPEIVLLLAAQGTEREEIAAEETAANIPQNTDIALRSTWNIASLDITDIEPFEPEEIAIVPVPEVKPAVPATTDVTTENDTRETLVLDPFVDGAPMIAVMIDDLGISEERARLMSALPGPLTLAFMPYGDDVAALTEIATNAGHELFLHLPMEPLDATVDPGPHALLGGVSSDELMRQLLWNLERFDGYVGVNNHMGSELTQDPAAMSLVMAELGARDLMFVDSLTAPASVAYSTARQHGLPAVRRDLFIDNVAERDAILAQLYALEAMALHRGYALGIAHPYDITAEVLAEWLPSVQARGFRLVPASAIVEHNESQLTRTAAE